MKVGNNLNLATMKHLNNILSFLIIVFFIGACTADEYDLGSIDVSSDELVEGIAYTITHDSENPNIVYLTSLMGSEYTPLWNHPQGRSQDNVVTLKIPFAGTYEVQFGVQTRGGYVYGETVTFDVDQMYAGFIEDELWTLISGGQGKSKTWYLDLDGEQTTRFFGGPIWFFTSTYEWDNLHNAAGDNYIDADVWEAKKAILPHLQDNGEAVWYWSADWAGNQWMCDAADFGTMTFDLIGGANLTVDQTAYSTSIGGGSVQNGSYMLDTEKHTIKFTDAYPVHDESRDAAVTSATEFRILYASEDFLQILVVPEGACYNYISKDYRDNWVPEEVEEPEPELPDGWQDDVSQSVSYVINWTLSPETPFNWANLDGSLMNTDWTSPDTYADRTGFNSSIPATYAGFSLELNSQTNSVEYTAPDGSTQSGVYTLDENGIYTFTDVTPSFNICGDINLSTTVENQWRILQLEYDDFGSLSGMWVGARSTEKDEYMAYHLIPQTGSSEVDPIVAWKAALLGKTFKPDVNWFVDWVTDYPDFTGGWTSSSTFGDDYTTNSWVWNESVRNIAESASLTFYEDGGDIKVDVAQILTTEHQDENENWITDSVDETYSVTGTVTIDTETGILTIDVPLIDYAGSPARWLGSTGNDNQWYFVSHGGSSLSSIDENGLWLGYTTTAGSEAAILHYLVSN